MATSKLNRNPLEPLSFPLGVRAAMAASLAIYILLRGSAPKMISELSGESAYASVVGLVVGLVLLVLAIWDGKWAFRTRLQLPERSIKFREIDWAYRNLRETTGQEASDAHGAKKLLDLILSGENPNERFLSFIGKWTARASDRLSRIPVPYQRLFDIPITAIALGVTAWAVAAILAAYGHARGIPYLSEWVLSWYSEGLVVLAYIYWATMLAYIHWVVMLPNVHTAAKWGKVPSAVLFVAVIGSLIAGLAVVSFATQPSDIELPEAPSLRPLTDIVISGSVLMVAALVALTWLRSFWENTEMKSSRIQLSDSAAVHHQSIVTALGSILQQSGSGRYAKLGDWKLKLEEQKGMPGGKFTGSLVGEYGAAFQQVAPQPIRLFATGLGVAGIIIGAAAYIELWNFGRETSVDHLFNSAALWLFGQLALSLAAIPLSESLWKSHLMAFEVQGSYQGRGAMLASAIPDNLEYGSFLVDYSLDGGVAKAYSVAYLPSAMVKADATRWLANTVPDKAEAERVQEALEKHLARAAGDRSKGYFPVPKPLQVEEPVLLGRRDLFPLPAPGHPAAILRGMDGPVRGKLISVEKTIFRIGRDGGNDLVIEGDPSVSGSHVYLCHTQGNLILIDQHSRDGTWLNGTEVSVSGAKIVPGDLIRIGLSTFEVDAV